MLIHVLSLTLGAAFSALISFNVGFFKDIKYILFPFIIWFLLYFAIVITIFACLFLVSLLFKKTPYDKPNKICYFTVKAVMSYICLMARVKVHVKNGELIEKNKQYLLVCNHRSKFDPIVQTLVFKRCKPLMVSKPENMKIPIAGPFINKSGFLSLDRNNDREALKTIIKAVGYVKDYDTSIGIYPEGTRNREGRDLLPFKAGAFKIATKAKIPIAIMTVEGTQKIHKNFPFKRTHVYLDVLKVITPEEYLGMNTSEISEKVSLLMQNNIDLYTKGNEECEKMSA